MRALKALETILVLIFLLTTFTSLGFFQPVSAAGLILTVTPDRTFYLIEDLLSGELDQINIQANLTLDGTPVPDGLIALEVRAQTSYNSSIVFRTLQTDTPPTNVNINITKAFPANSTAEPIDSIVYESIATYFFAEVKNIGSYPLTSVLITVNFYQNLRPFHNPIQYFISYLAVNGTTSMHLPVPIPWDWVSIGTVVAHVSVFSDYPRNGGFAYCPEKTSAFEIVEYGTPPSGTSPPSGSQNYNLTFKFPPDSKQGTYNIYGVGHHGMEYTGVVGQQIAIKLPGDGDKSGKVDLVDLFALTAAYGSKLGDDNYDVRYDINEDGKINWWDLFTLAANYGRKA